MEATAIGKNRQVLGRDDLGLPGLNLLGHSVTSRADTPMVLHTHAGAMEFVAALKGNERYYVDNRTYSISGGDVFVSFVDQPHGNGGAPQGISEFIWFQIDPRPDDLLGLSHSRAETLREQLNSIDSHLIRADRECLTLLKKSLAGFLKMDGASRQSAASLFTAFLFRLLSLRQPAVSNDERIERAIAYIGNNLGSALALGDMAKLCGMSLSGFKHRFKECTGETPRGYINQCKVEEAKRLLREGRTVTETAMELGFSSSEYFAVVFRKHTTLPPGRFAGNA